MTFEHVYQVSWRIWTFEIVPNFENFPTRLVIVKLQDIELFRAMEAIKELRPARARDTIVASKQCKEYPTL